MQVDLVLLREEIEFISNYFYLLKIRFDNSINMTIEINDVDAEEFLILPISLQTLVENAIKHGLPNVDYGCLLISVRTEHADLLISVRDNGPGFNADIQHGRFGLYLTYERIRLLNQVLHPKKVSFNIARLPGANSCVFKFENWL